MLSIAQLAAQRGNRLLFSALSLTFQAGDCVHLRGENGVGKTTLLKLLAGLTQPLHGEISWGEQKIAKLGDDYYAQLHYLGHKDALKELLSPFDNLQLTAKLAGNPLSEAAVLQALAQVGLARQSDLPVRSLSQGQKKRAALARLVATPRPLWLLDEPFVGLDAKAQEQLGTWISEHCSNGGITIFTSHQIIPETIPNLTELNLSVKK
ncbi:MULTISPECIES: cytochrome c biogenesis heme-transporting ATPase CcmA [Deefgea]|uniref:Cytochrome c biogenesis heme-transporting ATPase CcmA n=1 Tax=Deefgea chitinilytica TaxID=570276 RepID=A0ABS2CC22_9NEIS|nr:MULTISPECIES: cytochrome c biogenesis heme-transporting ATPase CcmA [Deefgea]MBM5571699.1 cytochrome c biogenesis heme-transporting ATPase CcmA [Deefgea chitinilytica]MBM9888934.1 cytochrome c biogenesis heme-transporting ATPase CcmA [Deefgea sp. CFH1-16]